MPLPALITLAELKEGLQKTQANQDTILQNLCYMVSDFLEGETRRRLVQRTYTKLRTNGWGTSRLVQLDWPIVAITSLTVYETAQTWWFPGDAGAPTDKDVYVEDGADPKHSKQWTLVRWAGWPRGVANIEISYTAGYKEADVNFPIPYDLKQAALIIARHWYYLLDRQRQGIQSVSQPGQTVNYLIADIPKEAKPLIEPYKRPPYFGAIGVPGQVLGVYFGVGYYGGAGTSYGGYYGVGSA